MNRACYNQIQLQNRNVIFEGDIFWLRGKSGRDEIWNYNRLMLIIFCFDLQEGNQFMDPVFNDTVQFTEPDEGLDTET